MTLHRRLPWSGVVHPNAADLATNARARPTTQSRDVSGLVMPRTIVGLTSLDCGIPYRKRTLEQLPSDFFPVDLSVTKDDT